MWIDVFAMSFHIQIYMVHESYMKSESKHECQGSSLLPDGYHNSKFELTLETWIMGLALTAIKSYLQSIKWIPVVDVLIKGSIKWCWMNFIYLVHLLFWLICTLFVLDLSCITDKPKGSRDIWCCWTARCSYQIYAAVWCILSNVNIPANTQRKSDGVVKI